MGDLVFLGMIGLCALFFAGMALKAMFDEGFHFGGGIDLVIFSAFLVVGYWFIKDTAFFNITKAHLNQNPTMWGTVIVIFVFLFSLFYLTRAGLKEKSRKTKKKVKPVVDSEPAKPEKPREPEFDRGKANQRANIEFSKPPFECVPFSERIDESTHFISHTKDEFLELFDARKKEIRNESYRFLSAYHLRDRGDFISKYYDRTIKRLVEESNKKRAEDDQNNRWDLLEIATFSAQFKNGLFDVFKKILGDPDRKQITDTSPQIFLLGDLQKSNFMIDTPREWSTYVMDLFHDLAKKSNINFLSTQTKYIDSQRDKIHERNFNDDRLEMNEKSYEKDLDDLYGNTPDRAFSQVYSATLCHLVDIRETYKLVTLPFSTRFEHSHILAGSGHGKTQLLQNLISADIQTMAKNKMGVIIIDGQGDMIESILKMKAVHEIKDRVILVDPSDVENPFCLNPFNLRSQFKADTSPVEKANLFNSSVQLLTFVFSSLLETKLTAKQGTLFTNVLALMVHREGSTLDTMFEILKDHNPFMADIENLPKHPKDFFHTEFDSKNYAETREQVKSRLDTILTKPALTAMFSTSENKLNLYEEMNRGSLILVDTNKDLLKKDGHGLLGRYFVEQILQSALRRKNIDKAHRTPCFVYLDEAQDYLDENTADLLAQARKYKVAMTMAHQFLDQLTPELKSAFSANTQIKFVGNVNAKDRSYSARDTGASEKEISALKKRDYDGAEYVLKIGSDKPKTVFSRFGVLESFPKVFDNEVEALKEENRLKYCEPINGDNMETVSANLRRKMNPN